MMLSQDAQDRLDALRAQDLNQLIALDMLLSQASVTRAANALGVTQPTMSKALRSLRDCFGDLLLVREGNMMVLTPFALDLAARLQEVLTGVSQIYEKPGPFDPQNIAGRVRVVCNDYIQAVLCAPLVQRMNAIAPKVTMEVRPFGVIYPEQMLMEGLVDMIISINYATDRLHQQHLFSDPYICVAGADNERITQPLSINNFLKLKQVDVSPTGFAWLRQTVAGNNRRLQQERQIIAQITSFLALPDFLSGTDLVAVVPSRVLGAFPTRAVRQVELDFELPQFNVTLCWHNRTHTDALMQWTRSEIKKCVEDL